MRACHLEHVYCAMSGARWHHDDARHVCLHCGGYRDIGPSPGTIRREMRLAEELADIARLWEPGHARDVLERAAVERWR